MRVMRRDDGHACLGPGVIVFSKLPSAKDESADENSGLLVDIKNCEI